MLTVARCSAGFSYDWDREVSTTSPEYYKWTQWIFCQLFKRGLAYQAEVPVNWCPALGTVLANEEVIDGKSERGDHPVVRLPMKQVRPCLSIFYKHAGLSLCQSAACYTLDRDTDEVALFLANEGVLEGKSKMGDHLVLRLPMKQVSALSLGRLPLCCYVKKYMGHLHTRQRFL